MSEFLSRLVVRGGCQRDYAAYVRRILPMTVVVLRSPEDESFMYGAYTGNDQPAIGISGFTLQRYAA